MTTEQSKRAMEVFRSAMVCEPERRADFLAEACAGEPSLRQEVESLIAAHHDAGSFLECPATEAQTEQQLGEAWAEVGRQLGPYRVLGAVGRGGMGEVYLALDTRLGRKVALKMLAAGVAQDRERLARFRQEARAASALNHPNILTIHEVGEHESMHFMATEFVEGQTLRELLREKNKLEAGEALEVAIQVASALAAAHEAGIVHRDVKPENVMLRRDGYVKVLDFGLAKLMEPAAFPSVDTSTLPRAYTSPGIVMGTVSYMSPEQARGLPVDGRTDVFSLGVVLYEMVAGRPPFSGATSSDVLVSLLEKEPTPLSEVAPEVPGTLAGVVARALRKDPAERYPDIQELLAELQRLRLALSSGATAVARPRWRRRRAWLAMAAVVVAATAAYLSSRRREPSPPSPGLRSLAVVPTRSLAQRESEDYLTLGIADSIIGKMGGLRGLTVRPTSAVRGYLGKEADSLAAGRELKVDAVLELSAQREAERIRTSVHLLRVENAASLWTDRFDVPLTDVFGVQDEIARQVAARLRVELAPSEVARLVKRHTASPEAYEYYLRGLQRFDKGRALVYGREDVEAAIGLLGKAIELDPGYALAHAVLAHSYAWMGLHIQPDNPAWSKQAEKALEMADRLDPELAEAHIVRHELLWSPHGGFDIAGAIRELRLAVQLNPTVGHGDLGTLYAHIGLAEASLPEFERALTIDPTDTTTQTRLVGSLWQLCRPDDAIAAAGRFNVPLPIGAVLRKKQLEAAEREIERGVERDPGHVDAASGRAILLALKGRFHTAEARIPDLLPASWNDRATHHRTYDVATIYALSGQGRQAVHWLKQTVDLGMPNYTLFACDPLLDRVRSQPAFVQFMDELRPRWEAYGREFQ